MTDDAPPDLLTPTCATCYGTGTRVVTDPDRAGHEATVACRDCDGRPAWVRDLEAWLSPRTIPPDDDLFPHGLGVPVVVDENVPRGRPVKVDRRRDAQVSGPRLQVRIHPDDYAQLRERWAP